MSQSFTPDLCQSRQYLGRDTPNLGGVGEGQAMLWPNHEKCKLVKLLPFRCNALQAMCKQDGYLRSLQLSSMYAAQSNHLVTPHFRGNLLLTFFFLICLACCLEYPAGIYKEGNSHTHPTKIKGTVKGNSCTSRSHGTGLEPVVLWSPRSFRAGGYRLQREHSNASFSWESVRFCRGQATWSGRTVAEKGKGDV